MCGPERQSAAVVSSRFRRVARIFIGVDLCMLRDKMDDFNFSHLDRLKRIVSRRRKWDAESQPL